ncbi:MAG: hypothetical protein PWR27_70 [Petroclostridium sp.]|jgi:hypothetical protein|nr:hypothetical protein [Clostridia bacterium]MDK2809361.1 hypothetical protein [Petroclostridium sp.]
MEMGAKCNEMVHKNFHYILLPFRYKIIEKWEWCDIISRVLN